MTWPFNYQNEERRRAIIAATLANAVDREDVLDDLYGDNPVGFINDWCLTFDPRNSMKVDPYHPEHKMKADMPFILFNKQRELVQFLHHCVGAGESGLIEKSRDMGATWVAVAFSVWLWRFVPGATIGWGSRKEQLVDRIGDPSSIFEKLRKTIFALPPYLLPEGFDPRQHSSYMKITGAHGATITGESGDNIGRGGRTTIYFKDESAHYERPELIEAALGDNTDCQIDISSVNGPNNLFHRKRHSGAVKVFILDWRDHPGKDLDWYAERRTDAEDQGLMHIFAQEVDRDYTASVEGVLIPGVWVKAAIDAHLKLGIEVNGAKRAGFDVADEGADTNAIVMVHGIVVTDLDNWGVGDTAESTAKAFRFCEAREIPDMVYDSVGVGAGVKAAANRSETPVNAIPYNGVGVKHPDRDYVKGKKNKDMFASGSAQDWWLLRDRFFKTYNAVVKNKPIEHDELISLSSDLPKLQQLASEMSQVTRKTDGKGRIVIEKTPAGTKSPNLADGLKMAMSDTKDGRSGNVRIAVG